MQSNYRQNRHILLTVCCLLLLLTACSATTNSNDKITKTPTSIGQTKITITPTRPTTTLQVPPTETSCPAANIARPMVTAPLVLGTNRTITYIHNEGTYDAPIKGTILRYDLETGHTTMLFSLIQAQIYETQVSADGQWILFVTVTGATERQSKLQLIRLDGQGLQTLYSAPDFSIQQALWS